MKTNVQNALIELVLLIAGMLMHHINIFGRVDLESLSEKMNALIEALIE